MRWVSLVLLSACSYAPTPGATSDGPTSDGPGPVDGPITDAPSDGTGDTSTAAFCDTGNPELRLCFDFNGDVLDRSGNGNNPNIATGVSFTTGVNGMAVVTTGSRIEVPDDSSLAFTDLTIRMHIKPTALPTTVRQGLIENDAFRMFVQPGGGIRCALNSGDPEVLVATPVVIGVFTRITCTFDQQVLRVFYNGTQMGMTAMSAQVTNVNVETTIGQSQPADPGEVFNGAIDELEVYSSLEAP